METEKTIVPAQENQNRFAHYKPKTMVQIVAMQFVQHRLAVAGLCVILFFILLALLAPVITMITGLSPSEQNMFHRFAPCFSTVAYTSDMISDSYTRFVKKNNGMSDRIAEAIKKSGTVDTSNVDFSITGVSFLMSIEEIMARDSAFTLQIASLKSKDVQKMMKLRRSFQKFHVFGTDELGRDVLIRLIYGARISIGVGVLVAVSAALIGLMIGCFAGFYGGMVDSILMRVTDSLLSLPLLPIMIIMCAVDLNKIPILSNVFSATNESFFKLFFVLTIFNWMAAARLVRGCILSLKEQDFILAAKTLGARNNYIILIHLIPNVIAPLLVEVTLRVGQAILTEAAMSFLGLGIQPPTPSWGNMIMNAIEIIYKAPIIAIMPGIFILLVVMSFNFLGDGLQDAVNPQSIRR
ncbi:MAG: ABC transporter permease [Chitinivibrionales bacterium]|nr:ABC transporter permease [Chitinivibrionales bacterium]